MMKQVLVLVLATLFAGMVIYCKNAPGSGNTEESATELPPERSDSLVGFKGCDRAGFKAISPTVHQFIYQDFIVEITDNPDGGEGIRAYLIENPAKELKVFLEGKAHFRGAARGQLLVEEEKGPNKSELVVFSVSRQAVMFQKAFCGDVELMPNGNIWFNIPADSSKIEKKPECPEKKEWEKKGWAIQYGQRSIFSLVNRSFTRKSEYSCIPVKQPEHSGQ